MFELDPRTEQRLGWGILVFELFLPGWLTLSSELIDITWPRWVLWGFWGLYLALFYVGISFIVPRLGTPLFWLASKLNLYQRQQSLQITGVDWNTDVHRQDIHGLEWWIHVSNPSRKNSAQITAYLDRVEDAAGKEIKINRPAMNWDSDSITGYVGPEDYGRFEVFRVHTGSSPQGGNTTAIMLAFGRSKPVDFLSLPGISRQAEYFVSFRLAMRDTKPQYAVIRFRPLDVVMHSITTGQNYPIPIHLIHGGDKPAYGRLASSLRSVSNTES